MRISLGTSLQSRDGTVTKDAKTVNALLEVNGDTSKLRKRPGFRDAGIVNAGATGAQVLTFWNGLIYAIQHDTLAYGCLTTTWNQNDKGSTITLSGGNLVARGTSTASLVRAAVSVSGPLIGTTQYAEFVFTDPGSGQADIGMANASQSAESDLGTTANSICYRATTGAIIKNNVVLATAATYTTGDVIGVFYDSGVNSIAFYKNDVLQFTAAGGSVPGSSLYMAASTLGTVTANFGAVAFTYTSHRNAATWMKIGSTTLSVSAQDRPFSAQDNGANAANPYLMLKNEQQAWTVNNANTVTQIADADYPGAYTVTLTGITRSGSTATATAPSDANFQAGSKVTIAGAVQSEYNGIQTVLTITPSVATDYPAIAVTSITRSGTTATVTTGAAHGLSNAQSVTIAGANQSEYDGTFTITWISTTSFSYTVPVTAGSITSPATTTGTLRAVISMGSALVFSTGAGTVTVTWANHGLETGAGVQLYFYGNIGASNPTALGAITVVDANTFTLAGSVPAGTSSTYALAYIVPAITSITGSGTTATVTFASAHHLTRYNQLAISGAAQSYYNVTGTATVTGSTTVTYEMPDATIATPATPATGTITAQRQSTATGFSFTYAVTGTPATPATGTITATSVRYTVPGIAYIDGYFVVMDEQGVLYNSAEDDPSTWNALEYIGALAEAGAGKAVAKSLQYVIAFKEWSTEYFFDAANDIGSPLSPVANLFTLVGMASGYSLAEAGGRLLWISQSKKQKGRGVHMMMGSEQQKVSTVDVDRIVNADDLADIEATGITLDGHPCYLLRLGTTGITLVYDLTSEAWGQFTSYTAGVSKSVTSIALSGTTATVTFAVPHTLSDGDPMLMAGANQSEYNGVKQMAVVSSVIATFEVSGTPVTPATGTITGTTYTESYFKFTKYASCAGKDLVLHKTDGHIYEVSSSLYQDAGLPINLFARTTRMDGGAMKRKKMGRISAVCTPVSDWAMVRWSDDDCSTFDAYRVLLLSDTEPMARQCGGFKRRTLEYRHIGNTAPVHDALELEVSQ